MPPRKPQPTSRITYVDAILSKAEIAQAKSDGHLLDALRARRVREALDSMDLGVTCHYKGFTSGISFSSLSQGEIVAHIVALLRERKVSTLVWDGDDYRKDSFTALIPFIKAAMPDLRLVAFLMAGDRLKRYDSDGFHASWADVENIDGLVAILVDDQVAAGDHYERLGIVALQATWSKLVVSVGGGSVALREYRGTLRQGLGTEYVVLDVSRSVAGTPVRSNLLEEPGVRIVTLTDSSSMASVPPPPRDVRFGATVINVAGVAELEQTFSLRLTYQLEWSCAERDAWRPEREKWQGLARQEIMSERCTWTEGVRSFVVDANLTFYAPLDLHDLPFDSHSLELSLVVDTVQNITLSRLRDDCVRLPANATALMEHSQWSLASINGEVMVPTFSVVHDQSGRACRQVSVAFGLHRRYEYAVWNVAVPSLLLSGSALTQWGVPRENVGERLGIVFGLLLALVALKLSSTNMVPALSYLTILDKYLVLAYVFCTAVAIESACLSFVVDEEAQAEVDTLCLRVFSVVWAGGILLGLGHAAWALKWHRSRTQAWLETLIELKDQRGGEKAELLRREAQLPARRNPFFA